MSSDAEGRSLNDFRPVFAKLETAEIEFILVAGQAVNFWAEYYAPVEPELSHNRGHRSTGNSRC